MRYHPLVLFLGIPAMAFAQDSAGLDAAELKGRPYSPYADRGFPTDVYFGDTNVHTSISADAGGGGPALAPVMPIALPAANR